MTRPFIPVPNTASVEIIYQNASEVNENVIHVFKGSPFSFSDLQALRGVVDTWDSTTGKTMRATVATLYRIRSRALDTASSPVEDYFLPTPRAGTGSGSPVPLNVALCIKLATTLAGRSFRGRWYCGNLVTGIIVDAGHVASATLATYVSNLNALRSALATAGYTLCVTSYRTGGAWRTTGLNTASSGFVGVDNSLDSMRRRLPGRGHTI